MHVMSSAHTSGTARCTVSSLDRIGSTVSSRRAAGAAANRSAARPSDSRFVQSLATVVGAVSGCDRQHQPGLWRIEISLRLISPHRPKRPIMPLAHLLLSAVQCVHTRLSAVCCCIMTAPVRCTSTASSGVAELLASLAPWPTGASSNGAGMVASVTARVGRTSSPVVYHYG